MSEVTPEEIDQQVTTFTEALAQQDPEKDSSWYHYVCQHGSSNTPCPVCFPGAPAKDENWVNEVPAGDGISDTSNLG